MTITPQDLKAIIAEKKREALSALIVRIDVNLKNEEYTTNVWDDDEEVVARVISAYESAGWTVRRTVDGRSIQFSSPDL